MALSPASSLLQGYTTSCPPSLVFKLIVLGKFLTLFFFWHLNVVLVIMLQPGAFPFETFSTIMKWQGGAINKKVKWHLHADKNRTKSCVSLVDMQGPAEVAPPCGGEHSRTDVGSQAPSEPSCSSLYEPQFIKGALSLPDPVFVFLGPTSVVTWAPLWNLREGDSQCNATGHLARATGIFRAHDSHFTGSVPCPAFSYFHLSLNWNFIQRSSVPHPFHSANLY